MSRMPTDRTPTAPIIRDLPIAEHAPEAPEPRRGEAHGLALVAVVETRMQAIADTAFVASVDRC